MKNRIPELINFHFYQLPEEKTEAITKDFLNYENNEVILQYKFGLLYMTQNQQTETEIYSTCLFFNFYLH